MPSQTPETQDTNQAGPTPPPGFNVKPSAKERVLGAVGAVLNHGRSGFDESPLGKKIALIHSQRLNEAAMHHKNMATYAGILATGIDPETGQPLTPEKRQQYQDWYNAAKQAFVKSGGIDKDTKAAVSKGANIADAIIAHGQQSQQIRAGGGGGLTPPPKVQAQGMQTSEPQTPSASAPYDSQAQADAPRVAARAQYQQNFADWKRAQDLLHQHKMEEQAALQQAKAQNKSAPRPIHSGSLGVIDARQLAAQGQVFLGEDGEPIDLNKMSDSMGLYGIVRKNEEGKWETVYEPFSPNQRTVTVGNESYAVSPMDISKLGRGAGADLGQHITARTGMHEAPMLGPGGQPIAVPLTSSSTPATPGIKGRGAGGMTPPPAASSTSHTTQTTPQKPVSRGAKAPSKASPPPSPPDNTSFAPQPLPLGARPLAGVPAGVYDQFQPRVTAVRAAATQLFGDPENPGFRPLSTYADVVDDPLARDRVAAAWNLIRANMDRAGVSESSHGDIVNIIRNYLGTPGAVAASEVAKMEGTLDALHPREAEMLNRLFATYGTINGLRSITKASAAKFSARNMEQEVPIPGMNVRTSAQFYDKLATLAEEVSNGWKGVPPQMFTPGEREFDLQAMQNLQSRAKGRPKGKITPPPSSTKTTQQILREHGVIP